MALNFSNFMVFYNLSDSSYRTFDYKNQELKTIKKLCYDCNQFELLTKTMDEHNDESLKSYADELVNSRNEILSSKVLKVPFDYFDNSFKKKDGYAYYRTHSNNVKNFLKRFLNKSYLDFEPITIRPDE